MADPISLPPGVALGIIAFLLSLLPAGFFMWLWYLRRAERAVSSNAIIIAFFTGIVLVLPAFFLENEADKLWLSLSPATAHYFHGAVLPLQSLKDILYPALGTFLIVATVEEGLRYLALRIWLKRSASVNQVFGGLLIGIAVGLGFATLENTIYFLTLFQQGSYDTLVFVFFLRFLISTLAHISFSGIMGALIAQGVFNIYMPRRYYVAAFFIPWFLHGLFDLLLGISHGLYAVLILLPPLLVLTLWSSRRDFSIVHRKNGALLPSGEAPRTAEAEAINNVLKTMDSPWNQNAPWLRYNQLYYKTIHSLKHKHE